MDQRNDQGHCKKQYFWKTYFVVVEFQKRGLPHTHQSYNLAEEDKPRTPDDIDKTVTAEIPNLETQPLLHELVKYTYGTWALPHRQF